MYDNRELKSILEAAIFAAGEALPIEKLMTLFDEHAMPEEANVKMALADLQSDYEERTIELKLLASGYLFQVRQAYAPFIARLWEERPQKYSRAFLETLVIIAYRQPVTRGDIEDIRGVAVNSQIIRTLLERNWIRIVGHRDVPGKPSIFGTTKNFLDYFNLKSLEELPTLQDLKDLDLIAKNLEEDLSLKTRQPDLLDLVLPKTENEKRDLTNIHAILEEANLAYQKVEEIVEEKKRKENEIEVAELEI